MAIIKCKMCGGDLTLIEGQSVAECEYCGSIGAAQENASTVAVN